MAIVSPCQQESGCLLHSHTTEIVLVMDFIRLKISFDNTTQLYFLMYLRYSPHLLRVVCSLKKGDFVYSVLQRGHRKNIQCSLKEEVGTGLKCHNYT